MCIRDSAVLIAYLVVRRSNVITNLVDTLSMVPYIMPGAVTVSYTHLNLSADAAEKAAEEYYSSVSFDVSRYSRFTTTAKNIFNAQNDSTANATLRIYLDGVCTNTDKMMRSCTTRRMISALS